MNSGHFFFRENVNNHFFLFRTDLHYICMDIVVFIGWGKNGTRAENCRNFKKFLFSLKFRVKTGKKVGILKFLQISALVQFLPQFIGHPGIHQFLLVTGNTVGTHH